jgi:hypothetical protein
MPELAILNLNASVNLEEPGPSSPVVIPVAAPLAGNLYPRGIAEIYVCGLATDFCVAWTA